jgi:hypothetical protein
VAGFGYGAVFAVGHLVGHKWGKALPNRGEKYNYDENVSRKSRRFFSNVVMKTLIIGSGAREHAIAWSLRRSNQQLEIYCSPGNAGIAELAQCVPIQPSEQAALVEFARSETIDLTVVGPEAPLVAGLVDAFQAAGLPVFGPDSVAARLEGSKAFAKEFMARNRIPTAAFADSCKGQCPRRRKRSHRC